MRINEAACIRSTLSGSFQWYGSPFDTWQYTDITSCLGKITYDAQPEIIDAWLNFMRDTGGSKYGYLKKSDPSDTVNKTLERIERMW